MKHVLVCLHGWGGSKESFTELSEALKNSDIALFIPDLPGFGAEPEPKTPWTVDDYATWFVEYISKNCNLTDAQLSIIGHSHGGRISIKLAKRQAEGKLPFKIDHLYLCAAAGIRHPRHFKRIIGLTLAKLGKFFLSIPGLRALAPLGKTLLYKLVRVHDYEQASPVMQQTLIKVSAEDLRPLLKDIRIPTDLFWGKDDAMTPYSDALIMNKEIAGSILHSYDGVRHRVHRDKAQEIAEVIRGRIGTA